MIRPRFARRLERLHPGSFAFVMATGIVSTAELMLGRTALSLFFLVVAAIGYAVLWLLYGARLWIFPAEVWRDTGRPGRAFGFFTVVAGSNVLGVRLALAGNMGVAEGLAVVGAATWVLLAYGVLARLVFAGAKPRAADSINGTWLIWVVATQSVSVSVSVIGRAVGVPSEAAALTATSLWAFGAVLYVILMAIILARLVLLELNPVQASPPYWISMGATAITVVAGAHLLELPHQLPTILATRPFIQGVTFLLWAFGSWWIPFLVILTIWHYRSQAARIYEQTLWSMVFPLGMYAVATASFGKAAGVPLLSTVAGAEAWLALVAWFGVAGGMVISWLRPPAEEALAGQN